MVECKRCHYSIFHFIQITFLSRIEWPFKLLASVQSEDKKYSCTPKSGFHLSVNNLPCLVAEIQSDSSGNDRYRMLIQAACLVRLGNALDTKRDIPFIVMALYIKNSGDVERYLVFSVDQTATRVCVWVSPNQLHALID